MAVSGSKKEVKDFQKFIGFFKGRIAAISPTRDKLNKLLGIESDKEDDIDYTGEKEGVRNVDIKFWFEVEGRDNLFIPYKIRLEDQVRRNTEKDKIQLINSVGDTQWIEADEDNNYDDSTLFESFKHFTNVTEWELPNGDLSEKYKDGAKPRSTEILGDKVWRPALVGEEDLMELMKSWLSDHPKGINLRDTAANLLLDTSKLLSGNFKELQLTEEDFAAPVVALTYVTVSEDDPDKQYQNIYRRFLPATFMKFINNGCQFKNQWDKKKWNKWLEGVQGKEEDDYKYALKGSYILEPLKEYDPNEDVAASPSTKKEDVTATNNKY